LATKKESGNRIIIGKREYPIVWANETPSWQLHLQFSPTLQVEGLPALGALAESTESKNSQEGTAQAQTP
jgi:hypothetical protein